MYDDIIIYTVNEENSMNVWYFNLLLLNIHTNLLGKWLLWTRLGCTSLSHHSICVENRH